MLDTIADVKNQLPDVKIKFAGKIHSARIAGRENKFATVWFRIDGDLIDFEYSWNAILHSVQTGNPLTV